MSSALYWKSIIENVPESHRFSFDFKKEMSLKLFGHDGSLGGSVFIGEAYLEYFEKLSKRRNKSKEIVRDAKRVANLIKKHGTIELFFEC